MVTRVAAPPVDSGACVGRLTLGRDLFPLKFRLTLFNVRAAARGPPATRSPRKSSQTSADPSADRRSPTPPLWPGAWCHSTGAGVLREEIQKPKPALFGPCHLPDKCYWNSPQDQPCLSRRRHHRTCWQGWKALRWRTNNRHQLLRRNQLGIGQSAALQVDSKSRELC